MSVISILRKSADVSGNGIAINLEIKCTSAATLRDMLGHSVIRANETHVLPVCHIENALVKEICSYEYTCYRTCKNYILFASIIKLMCFRYVTLKMPWFKEICSYEYTCKKVRKNYILFASIIKLMCFRYDILFPSTKNSVSIPNLSGCKSRSVWFTA
jgi:hypothetical protein